MVSLHAEAGRDAYVSDAEWVVAEVDRVLGRPRGIRIGEEPDHDASISIILRSGSMRSPCLDVTSLLSGKGIDLVRSSRLSSIRPRRHLEENEQAVKEPVRLEDFRGSTGAQQPRPVQRTGEIIGPERHRQPATPALLGGEAVRRDRAIGHLRLNHRFHPCEQGVPWPALARTVSWLRMQERASPEQRKNPLLRVTF